MNLIAALPIKGLLFTLVLIVQTHGLSVSINLDPEPTWEAWKSHQGKVYASADVEQRHRKWWEENRGLVREHNSRTDVTFTLELNDRADMEPRPRPKEMQINDIHIGSERLQFAPDSWDWRNKGAVSPVKNQGQLGDPQSIGAGECMESFHFIQTGQLLELSTAEVHDCCTQGGLAVPDIFTCIHNIGGLCSQSGYPMSQGSCKNSSCSAAAQVTGGQRVKSGDEDAMKTAVYGRPVLALVDASHASFQLYRSGIYSEPACSPTRVDHALQVVGYGSDGGKDYWICKNSWGKSWGMDGYIWIARNKGNMCGIASFVSFPV
ncbi:procathepsin L-like [Mya arenaria]|uniref:procathepsin L-like n=1 Tax=Mya arenaria TaxID=6604 RepID=UPI0022E671BC|nr:procathepsin L-like [Mya arenaria]